ncbi:hypothetical protein [Staphylococcus phage vB_SauH_DELF3]|nr:hypothetical protein [Staphylococcus phage vB_SauH_DELF3]
MTIKPVFVSLSLGEIAFTTFCVAVAFDSYVTNILAIIYPSVCYHTAQTISYS